MEPHPPEGGALPGTAAPHQADTSTTGGLSPTRLARMHDTLRRQVDSGRLPGLVALVSRKGVEHADAIGTLAFDGTAPMRDTIFRIASVTKPITAVAVLILAEECRIRLDDPVDELLPELANRKVLRTIDSELDDTVPATRPITVRDLLTFRSGYGEVAFLSPMCPSRERSSRRACRSAPGCSRALPTSTCAQAFDLGNVVELTPAPRHGGGPSRCRRPAH